MCETCYLLSAAAYICLSSVSLRGILWQRRHVSGNLN